MEVSANKKNLLIIENDKMLCQEFHSIVSDIYHLIKIPDIVEVIPYLSEHKDDISAVLYNIHNFSAEDEEFLNEMNEDIRFSSIPVLLITGEQESDAETKMLTLGAMDCIHKPFHREAVKKRIENAIQLADSMSYQDVERMLKDLPSNIYLKDAECRYIFCTHYWHHLDRSADPNWTIRGKTDVEIRKDKENAAEAMKADMNVIKTGKGTSYTIEINTDGVQEYFEVIKEPYRNEQGKITGIIGLINQVTEYEQMKRKLQEIVRTDELTGLFSRYYFDEYLHNIQKKELFPICVISADCDGLKKINDTYGHLVGDEYIRMTSLLFRMVIPENGAVFRTGGDEFIILLPSTSEKTAQGYMDQMREKEKLFQIRGQKLSVSLGMSSIKSSADSAAECIATSDMNMYTEKRRKKKNRRS